VYLRFIAIHCLCSLAVAVESHNLAISVHYSEDTVINAVVGASHAFLHRCLNFCAIFRVVPAKQVFQEVSRKLLRLQQSRVTERVLAIAKS
jgi:hypothetical protein